MAGDGRPARVGVDRRPQAGLGPEPHRAGPASESEEPDTDDHADVVI